MLKTFDKLLILFVILMTGLVISCSADNHKPNVSREVQMQVDSTLLGDSYSSNKADFTLKIPSGWQALPDSLIKSNKSDLLIEKIFKDSSGSMLVIAEISSEQSYDSIVVSNGRDLRAGAAQAGIRATESAFTFNGLSICQWIVRSKQGSMIRFVAKLPDSVMQFDFILSDNNFKVAESCFGSIVVQK